ncbi:hypothetical protein Poli38472_013306 [Pythium oligandrum]|uniref:Myb-like domain-containing protein n=1 Tax=Pythium oligandrum TaxID=41045 RepID=A0A8K1C2V3_PYTOL|nr:hypothetical protein Poli38472_013306 [Pythium oligandrum]|eukprot:TMW55415.1 hypothetical protein Poli38472_013306 [Pythium oligandrum]
MNEQRAERQDGAATADSQQWRKEEHLRFMKALELFGLDPSGDAWQKITAYIQTRSIEEVRLHGRRYLQQLMHLQAMETPPLQSMDSMRFDLSALSNQNDLNGPNQTNECAQSTKTKNSKGKATNAQNPLSVAALAAANAMSVQRVKVEPPPLVVGHSKKPPVRRTVRLWTFQEDKIFEVALAAWLLTGKPYSWPKLATNLPGRSAKDVRLRYEQLVEDIARIEIGNEPNYPCEYSSPGSSVASPSQLVNAMSMSDSPMSSPSQRPPHHSGLSRRISPPPPIQVSPAKGKSSFVLDSPSLFSDPNSSTRNRVASSLGFMGSGMLSPTFLDFLAGEDKPQNPASDASSASVGRSDTPPSLFSMSGPLPSPLGLELLTPSSRRWLTPRGFSTTPRIWQEFLSDDFKLEDKVKNSSDRTGSCDSSSKNSKETVAKASEGAKPTESPTKSTM